MSVSVVPDDQQADDNEGQAELHNEEHAEATLQSPAIVVPDRADAPISEITERFFRAIIVSVPIDRIEELHLFSPLRQGGAETGIAVIAAREIIVPPVLEETIPLPLEAASEFVAASESASEPDSDSVAEHNADSDHEPDSAPAEMSATEDEASPYADDLPAEAPEALEALEALEAPEAPKPVVRHTVYTARYRLVQKGPERGKWEAHVVAEAEAPLLSVETVVRGVQRRAGEESDTTRFSAAQLARALRISITPAG